MSLGRGWIFNSLELFLRCKENKVDYGVYRHLSIYNVMRNRFPRITTIMELLFFMCLEPNILKLFCPKPKWRQSIPTNLAVWNDASKRQRVVEVFSPKVVSYASLGTFGVWRHDSVCELRTQNLFGAAGTLVETGATFTARNVIFFVRVSRADEKFYRLKPSLERLTHFGHLY